MKFRLWGTDAIVSQSWRQSTLGVLVIKMPHDDKYLKRWKETLCKPHSGTSATCHKHSQQQKRPTTFQVLATKLSEFTKSTQPGGNESSVLWVCWSFLSWAISKNSRKLQHHNHWCLLFRKTIWFYELIFGQLTCKKYTSIYCTCSCSLIIMSLKGNILSIFRPLIFIPNSSGAASHN